MIWVQTIGAELHSEDTEEGFENGTHVTWTTTMKAIMITRFISAAGDEMYPFQLFTTKFFEFFTWGTTWLVPSSCTTSLILASSVSSVDLLISILLQSHISHMILSFKRSICTILISNCLFRASQSSYHFFVWKHFHYIEAFLGLRFTTSTIVACICQFYWAFSHIFVRTSVVR